MKFKCSEDYFLITMLFIFFGVLYVFGKLPKGENYFV